MTVVSDTSPLNYLVLIGEEQILQEMYGGVSIPYAVAAELLDSRAPAKVRSWIERPPSWLELRAAPSPPASIPTNLGAGETQAILLAEILNADLLMDELLGKRVARSRNLIVTGTIGILRNGARAGLVDFKSASQRARDAGLYATDQVIADALRSI